MTLNKLVDNRSFSPKSEEVVGVDKRALHGIKKNIGGNSKNESRAASENYNKSTLPMYKLFYKFNDNPFELEPDIKYFFSSHVHSRALLHMHVGFAQADGVLVLTGEEGLGKTTLIEYLLNSLDRAENVVGFVKKTIQKDHEFLPAILTSLQIPVVDPQPKTMLSRLQDFLLEKNKLNKKVRLVIDEAQTLSQKALEVLCLLSRLQHNNQSLIQIVLIGTNELEVNIQTSENHTLKQQIRTSYRLQSLQIKDMREYIIHRLKIAGWSGIPAIKEEIFPIMYQLTNGVPYKINRYFNRLLLIGMLRKTQEITIQDVSNLSLEMIDKIESHNSKDTQEHEKHKEGVNVSSDHISQSHKKTFATKQSEQLVKNVGAEKTKSFWGKNLMIAMLTGLLISPVSIFVYNKLISNNLTIPFATTAHDHSGNNENPKSTNAISRSVHSAAETSDVPHGNKLRVENYVLLEIPQESDSDLPSDNNVPDTLLDIQKLSNKSSQSLTKSNEEQANKVNPLQ